MNIQYIENNQTPDKVLSFYIIYSFRFFYFENAGIYKNITT